MLILTRKMHQSIMIGDDIEIVITAIERTQVRLGITAPREVPVHRKEIYELIHGKSVDVQDAQKKFAFPSDE